MSLYDDDDPPPVQKTSTSSLFDDDDDPPPTKRKYEEEPSSSHKTRNDVKIEEVKGQVVRQTPEEEFPVKEHALLAVVSARKGERDEMQDSHILDGTYCLHKRFLKRAALYGIFDGHAGSRAARHCEQKLSDLLKTKLSSFGDQTSMEKSLKKTFSLCYKELDDAFLAEAKKEKPVWKDGTTATTVLVLNDSIFVANIGDSKAIVARFKIGSQAIPVVLTVDHNPTIYEERMRIQAAGASVVNGRVNSILEVSRSIGDGQFKNNGVICTPDMRKCTITEEDKFLIVACDGLWKSFSDEEAIQFVDNELKTPADQTWNGTEAELTELLWQRIVDRLTAEAVRRKCGDNVSVILVRLCKLPNDFCSK